MSSSNCSMSRSNLHTDFSRFLYFLDSAKLDPSVICIISLAKNCPATSLDSLQSMLYNFLQKHENFPNYQILVSFCLTVSSSIYLYPLIHAKSTSAMSDSLRPYALQSSRLLCPWNSPGKNTGTGCPPPGDLSDGGIEPASLTSPALSGRFFTTSTTWESHILWYFNCKQ